ncbi:MAG: alpha/beta fold hydrolase [Polyangiaceae bacterium]
MTEIWLEHRGARLFAVEEGSGPPIVLLHGGLATHVVWLPVIAPLVARFRVVLPDLRACGRSHFSGELSWGQLADDVAALLRHLGIARAVVGGASLGAGVAVRLALDHPDVVSALAVIYPAHGGADVGLSPVQREAMERMEALGRRAPAEGAEVLLPLFDVLPPERRARAQAIVPSFDPASIAASTRFMASGAQPFARGEELAAIGVPVLVVPGVDAQHPAELAEVFRRNVRRCAVREIEPTGFGGAIGELAEGGEGRA